MIGDKTGNNFFNKIFSKRKSKEDEKNKELMKNRINNLFNTLFSTLPVKPLVDDYLINKYGLIDLDSSEEKIIHHYHLYDYIIHNSLEGKGILFTYNYLKEKKDLDKLGVDEEDKYIDLIFELKNIDENFFNNYYDSNNKELIDLRNKIIECTNINEIKKYIEDYKEILYFEIIKKDVKRGAEFEMTKRILKNEDDILVYMDILSKKTNVDISYEKNPCKKYFPVEESIKQAYEIIKIISPNYAKEFLNEKDKFIEYKLSKDADICANVDSLGIVTIGYTETIMDVFIIVHEFIHKLSSEDNKQITGNVELLIEASSICSQFITEDLLKEKIDDNLLDDVTSVNKFYNIRMRYDALEYIYYYHMIKLLEQSEIVNSKIVEEYFKSFGLNSIEYLSYNTYNKIEKASVNLGDPFVLMHLKQQQVMIHPIGYIIALEMYDKIKKSKNFEVLYQVISSLKNGVIDDNLNLEIIKNGKLNVDDEFIKKIENTINQICDSQDDTLKSQLESNNIYGI